MVAPVGMLRRPTRGLVRWHCLPDRGRAMMMGAGRMTAKARADTGALEARREAWVRGLRTDV